MRSSWLFGPTGHNFVRTMLRLGAERDEVAVVDDQRGSPTYVGHLAAATRQVVDLPFGVYHVAAEGECTWAEFAEAIFEEAGLDTPRAQDRDRGARPARRRRDPRTPSSAARRARRSCRTGATACARCLDGNPCGGAARITDDGGLLLPDDVDPRRAARGRLGRDLRDRALARVVAGRQARREARAG